MKKLVYDFFQIASFHFEQYQLKQYQIDPKQKPIQLIKQLKIQKIAKKLINQMNEHQQHGARLLRRYTIIHWCLVHDPQLCQVTININFNTQSKDQWLSLNILKSYGNFLHKISSSQQYYTRTKPNGIIQFSFDMLFYIINLLKQLFLVVKKISPLARYYKKTENQQYKHLLQDFVQLNAFHAQELYNHFKIILAQIIRFPHKYIHTQDQKVMIKYLLEDELLLINQEMKGLFLDKYFYPYGKGYILRLMKIEDLTDQSKDFVEDLLFNFPIKVKKQKKKTLDSVLFDQSGRLNPEIVYSLSQIRLGDQTMRNSFEDSCNSQRYTPKTQSQISEQI